MVCWCCINRKRTAYSKVPQSSKQGASEKKKFFITSLLLPNYHDYKKDINENENSSKCFPNDLITLAAFSICEQNHEWKVKTKPTSVLILLERKVIVSAVLSINSIQLYIFCLLKQLKAPFEKVYSPRISGR